MEVFYSEIFFNNFRWRMETVENKCFKNKTSNHELIILFYFFAVKLEMTYG